MGTKLYIKTYGCQMNEYDSDKTVDILKEKKGVELTNDVNEADIVLLNTCSIRDKALSLIEHVLSRTISASLTSFVSSTPFFSLRISTVLSESYSFI